MEYNHKRILSTLVLSNLLLSSNTIFAGGFQMHEQNSSLGDVHAGYAVDKSDASVSFYNPALLTEILTPKATSSAVTVANRVKFKGTTLVETDQTSAQYPPITGSGSASTSGIHVIPAMHYAAPLGKNTAFGLSIASPYAASIDWPEKEFTRYNSTLNSIKTINFSPSLAYKFNNRFSVGAGFDIQYVEMQINKVVGSNFDLFKNNLPLNNYDSKINNNLTNTGYGWHAGLAFKLSNNFRLGVNYRSRIDHKAKGTSKLSGKLAGKYFDMDPTPGYADYSHKENKSKNLKALIKIPQTLSLSAKYKPSYNFSLVSTVIYTNWSIVDSFDLRNVPSAFVNPVIDDPHPLYIQLVKNDLKFRDTFALLNGLHWKFNNNLLLKTGFGFDQTPTNNKHRDLKMPDGNRYLFGLGANYRYSKNLSFEAGYMFVLVNKTKLNNDSTIHGPEVLNGNTAMNPGEHNKINGHASANAHLFGLQFTLDTEDLWGYTSNKLSSIYGYI